MSEQEIAAAAPASDRTVRVDAAAPLLGDAVVLLVGEPVASSDYLKGFNTHLSRESGQIVSSACGVVEVVERVVSVRGLSPRYIPEAGDVVVGRISEVSGNRWKCDLGGHQDAVMLLANVTEPGGMLRRRGREDELTMRTLFETDDIFAAEVQRVLHDGVVSLHTRSALKYGRLTGTGQLVTVKPYLIRRVRKHFHHFRSLHVSAIFGMNGRVWLGPYSAAANPDEDKQSSSEAESAKSDDGDHGLEHGDRNEEVSDGVELREAIARLRNCCVVLDANSLPICPRSLWEACKCSITNAWKVVDVLAEENREAIINAVTRDRKVHRRKRQRD